MTPLELAWEALPAGARAALEQQWMGLAAGGLACGACVVHGHDVVAAGRNHAYEAPGPIETRIENPLQDSRIAHAEMNALAKVPNDADHATLTVWSTQHPCLMCAAAMQFAGVGKVCFIADDPSDPSPPATIAATRGKVPYEALDNRLWWNVANLLFLYNPAIRAGAEARNIRINRHRYPELVELALDLAERDALGPGARSGLPIVEALEPHYAELEGL